MCIYAGESKYKDISVSSMDESALLFTPSILEKKRKAIIDVFWRSTPPYPEEEGRHTGQEHIYDAVYNESQFKKIEDELPSDRYVSNMCDSDFFCMPDWTDTNKFTVS